jgi:hypothetical protein
MMDVLKNHPTIEIHSAMLGTQRVPETAENMREFVAATQRRFPWLNISLRRTFNNTIRMDKQNKYKLRAVSIHSATA